jgi:hypothetical protein
MEKLTFAEVSKIEGVVGNTNSLIAKYSKELGITTAITLPTHVGNNASDFRIKVERVHGVLVDIARLHATNLHTKLQGVSEKVAAQILDSDKDMNQILEAIVSLNGGHGFGHQTINEIAKLTSKQPSIIALVKAKIEKQVHALADKFARDGKVVMDIIRHAPIPQKQCLFSA